MWSSLYNPLKLFSAWMSTLGNRSLRVWRWVLMEGGAHSQIWAPQTGSLWTCCWAENPLPSMPPTKGKYFSASLVINTIKINQLAFFHNGKFLGGPEAMGIWTGRRSLKDNVAGGEEGQIWWAQQGHASIDREQGRRGDEGISLKSSHPITGFWNQPCQLPHRGCLLSHPSSAWPWPFLQLQLFLVKSNHQSFPQSQKPSHILSSEHPFLLKVFNN